MNEILGIEEDLPLSEEEFSAETTHDDLTGFYNKHYMQSKLSTYVEEDVKVSIILFDITNFKNINNFYGYDIGDEVLKHFAFKLKSVFEGVTCDFIRRDSDKFYVIVEDCLEDVTVVTYANTLLLSLSDGLTLNDGQNVLLKCTYGMARLPIETKDCSELVKLAELHNGYNKDNSIYEVE